MVVTSDFEEQLRLVLHQLPPVQYAFAYGSGVFHQPGLYNSSLPGTVAPMVDFMFAVEDPETWHAEVESPQPSDLCVVATICLQHFGKLHGRFRATALWVSQFVCSAEHREECSPLLLLEEARTRSCGVQCRCPWNWRAF
jgi:Phosphatidate cytidylyltransferase, mitochondrial